MMHLFKEIRVLEKQIVMAKRDLKQVWSTDDQCTEAVMEMFAACRLETSCKIEMSTEQEYELFLHLVL